MDIYQVDTESRENCLKTAASITTNSLPRGTSTSDRGGSTDIDAISEVENGLGGTGQKRRDQG